MAGETKGLSRVGSSFGLANKEAGFTWRMGKTRRDTGAKH